jgi:hypothetical protein
MGRSEDMLSENQYRSGYYDGFVDAWGEIDNLLEGLMTNNDIQSVIEFYINYRLSPWLHSDCSKRVMPPIFDIQELKSEVDGKRI